MIPTRVTFSIALNVDQTSKIVFCKAKRKLQSLKQMDPRKVPGNDLITGEMQRKFTEIAISHGTHIFNAILRLLYYLKAHKISDITLKVAK